MPYSRGLKPSCPIRSKTHYTVFNKRKQLYKDFYQMAVLAYQTGEHLSHVLEVANALDDDYSKAARAGAHHGYDSMKEQAA